MQLKLNPSLTLTPNVTSDLVEEFKAQLWCQQMWCESDMAQISQNAELVAKLTLGQHCCYSQINYMSKFDT